MTSTASPARNTFPAPVRAPRRMEAFQGLGARSAAFTLIELMVVVALIGIMTAMIIPEMKGTYEDALLRSTGRELVGALNLASSRAVSLNRPHRVHLDPTTGHYAIERSIRDRARGISFVPVKDVPGGEGELDPRISIDIFKPGENANRAEPGFPTGEGVSEDRRSGKQEGTVVFYPDGSAEPAELRLQDREGFRLALRINPVTGRVRVVELERP